MVILREIFIARSDGKLQIVSQKGVVLDNGPTAKQLAGQQGQDGGSGKYREVELREAKSKEWRRKLAGLLMKALNGPSKHLVFNILLPRDTDVGKNRPDEQFILADFPENYRLFEHHRASGDRNDAYLYGYPRGERVQRYRSPADFLPHLLWLGTNPTADYDECSCKLCVPDDYLKASDELHVLTLEINRLRARSELSQADGSLGGKSTGIKEEKGKAAGGNPALVKVRMNESVGISHAKATQVKEEKSAIVDRNPAVIIPRISTSQAHASFTESASRPISEPAVSRTAPTSTSAFIRSPSMTAPQFVGSRPLPPMLSEEQRLDAESEKLIFRPGELVWNDRSEGQATSWGLSVITARSLIRSPHSSQLYPHYTVQPLSHPYHSPPAITLTQPAFLRPFLAWSTPKLTHEYLRTHAVTYSEVDWLGILNNLYGEGDAQVDGSILGAKAIDASYTLIQSLTTPNASNPFQPTHYNGIFLGAEKIWLGETLRLHPIGSNSDEETDPDIQTIMILHQLTSTPLRRPTAVGKTHDIHITGDIYLFRTTPLLPTSVPPQANPHLPRRLVADLAARNSASRSHAKHPQTTACVLAHSQLRLPISQVKGRWYESSLLLPMLQGKEEFQRKFARGQMDDVGRLLNPRGLGMEGEVRVEERVRAFGQAVPRGVIVRARTEVVEESVLGVGGQAFPMDPALLGQGGGGRSMEVENAQAEGVQEADLEEFVDVGQMD